MRSAKIKLSLDPALPPRPRGWANPVVPGDHPDPTIFELDGVFWASATSGEWSPQFPLFSSTDLVSWHPSGSIFPEQPAWADGAFWAPEMIHDEGSDRCFVWYVAKKRNGPLCIAFAVADTFAGPYTDHGPIICQDDGSIDPCFARDEHGTPFLIWKEDGNSQGRPTPIWAQQLSDDLFHLIGEKTLLITNDQSWEEGVVEGPYIFIYEGRFYMFYAGNSCCGKECKYAEGVARADRLLGPWEKFPGNPLISANDTWRCPGHGTAVHAHAKEGEASEHYLLYHAYPTGSTVYVGREAVLDKIAWTPPESDGRPGWPVINAGQGPGERDTIAAVDFCDNFETPKLGPSWQWPVNTSPDIMLGDGALRLGIPLNTPLNEWPVESAMLAVPRPGGLHYQAAVTMDLPAEPDDRLWAGLAIVGDPFNTIGLGIRGKQLNLWHRRGPMQEILWQMDLPSVASIHLRSASFGTENKVQFHFSYDDEQWQPAGESHDTTDLPAWDRGLRIALMLEGPVGLSATFHEFELRATIND